MSNQQEGSAQNDEDAELVSEFPPPPIYYTQSISSSLTPPLIPTEALARSTQKAVAQRKARELEEQSMFGGSSFGVTPNMNMNMDALGGTMPNFGEQISQVDEDGPTVAVFGEGCYVEVNTNTNTSSNSYITQTLNIELGVLFREPVEMLQRKNSKLTLLNLNTYWTLHFSDVTIGS